MTKTQYYALMEVAENGERFPSWELNITARTMNSMIKKGWVRVIGAVSFVTDEGWGALSA